jgi:hypothetical protein
MEASRWQVRLARTARLTSGVLAVVGVVVLLTDWIDWPWWIGVGLGSPLGFLLLLDDGFRSSVGDLFDSDPFDDGFFEGGFGGDGGAGGGDGGGG